MVDGKGKRLSDTKATFVPDDISTGVSVLRGSYGTKLTLPLYYENMNALVVQKFER